MSSRLIIRTHYQVSNPGIFSVILKYCTSPDKSEYPENIIKKLSQIPNLGVNKESSKFAVSMAHAFGFVTKNMFWDWKGKALIIVLDENKREIEQQYLKLTELEKILYLKYYLEADGAAILELCHVLNQKGSLSRSELLSTDIIDKIFIKIWGEYRHLTSDLSQLVGLRENINRLTNNPYTKKTRIHKSLVHLEPLIHLGLVDRKVINGSINYVPKKCNGKTKISRLVSEISSIENMEKLFDKHEKFFLISKILNIKSVMYDEKEMKSEVLYYIADAFIKSRILPPNTTNVSTITDVVGAKMLAYNKVVIDREMLDLEIDKLKGNYPRDVRYHVDMRGKKEYVFISEDLCEDLMKEYMV